MTLNLKKNPVNQLIKKNSGLTLLKSYQMISWSGDSVGCGHKLGDILHIYESLPKLRSRRSVLHLLVQA